MNLGVLLNCHINGCKQTYYACSGLLFLWGKSTKLVRALTQLDIERMRKTKKGKKMIKCQLNSIIRLMIHKIKNK